MLLTAILLFVLFIIISRNDLEKYQSFMINYLLLFIRQKLFYNLNTFTLKNVILIFCIQNGRS